VGRTDNKRLELLQSLPLLEGIGQAELKELAAAFTEHLFQPGQTILEEGSTGGDVHLIIEGRVEVVKGGGSEETVLAERGPGDLFGEMGLLERSPRFATVRALEPTRLLQLPEGRARALLAGQPKILYRTVQVLSARLRESDLHMIADLQRKNLELSRACRELKEAQAALVEKERLEHELELARDLQRSILPIEFPQHPSLSFAARSRPARQVGGDFYDVIPLREGRFGLVMADVSDKGMPAALFMALTRSLIRAEAKGRASPRRVLLNVHRLLLEISRAEMFVTVFYGVLDPADGSLRYARAGHDCPLVFNPHSGDCGPLWAPGMALGFVEEVDLEESTVHLHSGDRLLLYTDGITHAESVTGEFFGFKRIRETICGAGAVSAEDLCDRLFERIAAFQGGAAQYDDMALLLVALSSEN
jgi:serine phosphatase RsbU (regulator of sigma subunit)